jgi:hypothetical protein
MRINKFPSQLFARIIATGLTTVATITAIFVTISPNAQAQVPAGQFKIQSNNQILFFPANGSDPVLVYNAGGRAVALIQYGGAVYTAFDRGHIYRSPNGQDLGGGGRTGKVYSGSGTVNMMLVCQNALFTAFKGGLIYRSPDGQNLGGGGKTERVYGGTGEVDRMTCTNRDSVISSFRGGGAYESPDGRNLGGGGRTSRVTGR